MPSVPLVNKPQQQALFRPAMVLMLGRFLGFAAAFLIPVVLVRVFDQDQFGSYKQLFLIFGTLFGIAQVGMAESLYYFLPLEPRRGGCFVFNALVFLIMLGLLALGLLWWWRLELAQLMNNPGLAEYVPLVGLYLFFMLAAVLLEILMTIRKQYMHAGCSYAFTDVLRVLFYILPMVWVADLHVLMYGAIGFAMVRLTAALVYIRHEYGAALRPDRTALREHLAYAIPFGVSGLIEVLQVNFHLFAVSYYFDAATFAIYAIGCLQIPLSDFLMTSTCNVMMVNMREKIQEEEHDAVVHIWLDSVRKLALIFFPLVGCLIVVAQPLIVLLFTRSFEASVPIFMVWTLSMLFAVLLTDGVLRVFADIRYLIVQNLIRLGFVAATIPWFLVTFDLMGAVLASVSALALVKVIALGRIRVLMRVSVVQLLPWGSLASTLLIAVLAAAPALLVRATLHAPELVLLIATGLVYGCSYYFLLQRFGPMQQDEKQMLTQWLTSPFGRLGAAYRP